MWWLWIAVPSYVIGAVVTFLLCTANLAKYQIILNHARVSGERLPEKPTLGILDLHSLTGNTNQWSFTIFWPLILAANIVGITLYGIFFVLVVVPIDHLGFKPTEMAIAMFTKRYEKKLITPQLPAPVASTENAPQAEYREPAVCRTCGNHK